MQFCICHNSNTNSNGTFLQACLISFKHNLKLFYIFKFPELLNFCSQSQLPPICNTPKGGQGVM